MSDPHPRYSVRSITGYHNMGRRAAPTTSYWVADSWYGFAVVAEYSSRLRGGGGFAGGKGRGSNNWSDTRRREAAESRCAELNAEHDAWLRAG